MSTPSSGKLSIGSAVLSTDVPQLVQQCMAGKQSAIVELVARYQSMVFGLCFRMLGQREDAEDITQETFVRVLDNLDRYDPQRKFEPWLLTIAGNRCRTTLAQRKRRPTNLSLEISPEDHRGTCSRATLLEEEMNLALSEIRSEYRDAFFLFHREELSYEEIAERLSVPLGTVKTWVHRARQELVQKLRKRGAIGGDVQ
jgi:RNA polymerase sigma-70 factor (ECF subfamily)